MSMDLGNGVSRTLDATDRSWAVVVWQAGNPPLDSELNLIMQADLERQANAIRSQMPSGWLLDPFRAAQDFVTNELYSNWFRFGSTDSDAPVMWANVNGWIIPVAGSNITDDAGNRINLYPPPTSDARIDLVFLEVFLAQVAPNPSEVNKPSASTIWKYGNVLYGGTNVSDDLMDPAIAYETTERVQLQYRIRVFGTGDGLGSSVDLSTYVEGIDDPNVLAQGTADSPQVGFPFTNMREALGDTGLWRAGNGDPTNALGTVDGYVYAIPLCAVFRRNSTGFVARSAGGNANQNGALNRNPITAAITDPVEATRTFSPITLTSGILATTTGVVQVAGLAGSGYDNGDIDWDSVFLVIDNEVIYIESVDTTVTPGTMTIRATGGRGRNGTLAVPHAAGTEIKFFVFRPDGKTADMVTPDDILDMRHAVSLGGWDYQALLVHNLGALFNNLLRSSYKQSGISDTEGPVVLEVGTLYAVGTTAVPNQTEALDGPDGIRTTFSDAAVTQPASILLAPTTGSMGVPVSVADYTASAGAWGPAADFDPAGFQPNGGGWTDQAIIELNIGSSTLNGGARATVRDSAGNRIVRFLTPREWWLDRNEATSFDDGVGASGAQCPVQFRVLSEVWGESRAADETATDFPGPMFPLPGSNFERPFIFLGGVVNTSLRSTSAEALANGSTPSNYSQVRIAGLNFDTAGSWYPSGALRSLETEGITNLLLHGSRNLYDLLTNGGQDESGNSSELYLVLKGDTTNAANAGVFRVVGAGTIGYTTESGATAADLVVCRVGEGAAALVAAVGLTAEVRSQYTHAMDGNALAEGASAVIVLTDLLSVEQGAASPWNGLVSAPPLTGQAVVDTTLLYGPSRGGTARVANEILRVAMVGVDSATLLREAPTALDTDFDDEAGVPEGELYFPIQHVQSWNHLPSLGLPAPRAPGYGDDRTPGGEVRREAEVFVDPGSKTLVIRPFQQTKLTLYRYQATGAGTNRFFPETYAAGAFSGGDVDGGNLFVPNADYAYAVPWEFMPKLGRQDIPIHQQDGTTQLVYPGVNHLFADSQTTSDDVFRILGGTDSTSAVNSIFFQTGMTSGRDYGEYFSMGVSAAGYQARIYEDVTVYSSDVGRGLKGIQLPPFLGIARLYGVYDLREFAGQGAWNSDRVTKSSAAGRPKNLLKMDADKQTLFIAKGGGSDVTGNAEDHTYVIPENIIDVKLSGQYVDGDTFDTMEFVVEAVVFGFGRGFITQNNWVMARNNLPTGASGTAVAALADQVACILPLPLPYNEQVYVVYDRTVYQGDPYMTRDGATKTVSDYEHRYGQIPSTNAVHLATPIQQFDSTDGYAQVPQIPNARALEVLASIDFYTTLGTGKMGGRVWPGTITDVGHIESSTEAAGRIPASSTDPVWTTEPRAFTEGPQDGEAPRAQLVLNVLQDSPTSTGETITIERDDVSVSFISNTNFAGGTASAVATSLASAINASVLARFGCGAVAVPTADAVLLYSLTPGDEGTRTKVKFTPKAGQRFVAGFRFQQTTNKHSPTATTMYLTLLEDVPPLNGKANAWAATPLRMTGLTERLPLGILVQDSDFLGEDPMRDGVSGLVITQSGGSVGVGTNSPFTGAEEYGRIQSQGVIGMADGAILQYTPWSLAEPTGTKKFRLYRGGGSAYVLQPTPAGGPLDWSSGGYPAHVEPVLKGAVLAGRAFLVRNAPEVAYSGDTRRSYGNELQMVIVTNAVYGHGAYCDDGYELRGEISPTGFGDGFAAADRYRLDGKPLQGRPKAAIDPEVALAPYDPTSDEPDPEAC